MATVFTGSGLEGAQENQSRLPPTTTKARINMVLTFLIGALPSEIKR
jgi:hypothetical protein